MEQSKKYELLNKDIIELGGITLFRIKALISFGNVKKGELGGYVEKEDNLCTLVMLGSQITLGSMATLR